LVAQSPPIALFQFSFHGKGIARNMRVESCGGTHDCSSRW
jgi:hypothetical protein